MRKLVLVVVAVAGLLWGQVETILFGAAELRLGMSKAEAKAEVCANYPEFCHENLAPRWEGDFVIVVDMASRRSVGNLRFSNGRLVGIYKFWTPRQADDATQLAKALYSLVLDANQKGQAFATVVARTVRTPDVTGDVVIISFGSRSIKISTDEGELAGIRLRGVSLYDEYTLNTPQAQSHTDNLKARPARTR